jgi:L-lactate utilization protein LutB
LGRHWFHLAVLAGLLKESSFFIGISKTKGIKMSEPIQDYWEKRLGLLKATLEKNNFEAFVAASVDEAKRIVTEDIVPKLGIQSVAFGGSMTVVDSGLYGHFKESNLYNVIDTYDRNLPQDEFIQRRHQALGADLFVTGTNAVTENGQLVNLDMTGNRVAGITFGPKHVILLVGRNKVVVDLEDAMVRIKNYVAPANAMRLKMKTPCTKTGVCEECQSPMRICNTWTITEKSYGKGRVKVVLINQDLGL